ncbi:retrovirus-related pol polyprotein from transposon TNT 1-94 [Tanacetum coccineum]
MSENEDKYHDTVLDLEARAKKNEDVVLKMDNSLQGMFMLGVTPMSFYNLKVKHCLGYTNPYTLKKAISPNPKLYNASCLDDSKIQMSVRDTEDIPDDAIKNFVPQEEFPAEQKYFSSSFISFENSSKESSPSSSSKTTPTVTPIPRLRATSSVRRALNRDSSFKNSVLSNTKNSSEKVEVSYKLNKKSDVASKNVDSNKKIVTNDDIKNALIAKNVLCVSCAKNTVQSKSLDNTPVAFRTKIDAATPLSVKNKVVQIILWIVDSGCSKHMTGDRSLLKNFIEKFMGTHRFGNDHFTEIIGYGDYVQGNLTVCHVYYVEGLGHNLFRDRESNFYTISISNMAASSPVCLMSKSTSIKSWLWHRRVSHLNFGTINDLTKHDLVDGLLKFKYGKDHLFSACEQGKSKKASHPPKVVPSNHSKLELLHMDLCGPMRVASINEKRYILVIVDDYSRFTCVYFLRTKDETLEIIKNFIARVQLKYKAKVCKICTDNGTEFKNQLLKLIMIS